MYQGTKENIKRKLAGILTVFLIMATVLEYGPILSLAGETENSQEIMNLSAARQEDGVKLSWEYGEHTDKPDSVTGYEVWLEQGESSNKLDEGPDLKSLDNSMIIPNVRKTAQEYTISVYYTYLVTKPNASGSDAGVTDGNLDTSGSDTESGSEDSKDTYETKRGLITSQSVAWIPEYKVQLQVTGNGKIVYETYEYRNDTTEVYIKKGEDKTFTIIPEPKYEPDELTMPAGVTLKEGTTYSLADITEDIVVKVTFSEIVNPPVLKGSELSTVEENPTVLDRESQAAFQIPETGTKIYYRFYVNNTAGNWIEYTPESNFKIDDNYQKGKLEAKTVRNSTGKESSFLTCYYTTLPALPENLSFQLNNEGSGNSTELKKDNWVKEKDNPVIIVKNLPQGVNSSKDTYRYMLYLKPEQGDVVSTELKWSVDEGAYIYDLQGGIKDGVYQIGYSVKNAAGKEHDVRYTDFYLAYDKKEPEFSWSENGGHLIEKEGEAGHYYTNSDLQFQLTAMTPIPVSQIAFYSYKLSGGEWTRLAGNTVFVPLEDIENDTQIFFKAITNSGMTKETSFYVTKDVTPPGGENGTVSEELANITQEAVLYDKNPADDTCESMDTSTENQIYYQPSEAPVIVFSGVNEREADSRSKIYVKYKVVTFGTPWSKDGAETLRPTGGILKLEFDKIEELRTQGKYDIYIWTEDEAGNCSPRLMRTVCYDNTKPDILNPGFASGTFFSGSYSNNNIHYEKFANGSVEALFSVSEMAAGISKIEYYNIAGGQKQLLYCDNSRFGSKLDGTQTLSYKLTESAQYKLMIRVYDMAGNFSEAAVGNFGFILDNTAPVLSVDSQGTEGKWINGSANFQIFSSDAESGINRVEYSVDGQPAVRTDSQGDTLNFSVAATEEAKDSNGYTINISAFNNAGLAAKYSGKILIDKTAPVISLSGITPQQVYQGQAVLTVAIKEAIYNHAQASVSAKRKLDGVELQYDTGTFTFSDVESSNSFTFSADGEYTVVVSAKDGAGNAAASQGITFTVDSTAPVIKLGGILEGAYYSENPTLNLQVTESFYNTANVKVKVTRQNRGETTEYELPQFDLYAKESRGNYSFSEEGSYMVEVSAVDAAGNTAESQTLSFVLDKTAPQVAVEGFEHHLITDKNVTAQFLVSDDNYRDLKVTAQIEKTDLEGNVTESQVGMDTGTGGPVEAVKEFSEDGKYVLYLQAEDAAGNMSKLEKEFIITHRRPLSGISKNMTENISRHFS